MVPVLLIAALSTGCSLSLQGPDPLRSAHVAPSCDTGKGAVAADWVFAGLAATIALSALSADAGEVAALSALTSAAFIGSAARGNGVVNSCRAEIAAYSPPAPDNDDVARRPRRPGPAVAPQSFEDPYADPAGPPARRIGAKPAAAATATPTVAIPVPAPTPVPAKPAPTKVPPPPVADDWSDFWTEVP